jgi:hypothetical protein
MRERHPGSDSRFLNELYVRAARTPAPVSSVQFRHQGPWIATRALTSKVRFPTCSVCPMNLTLIWSVAGPSSRSRSGAAVAANDVRRTESRNCDHRDAVTLAVKQPARPARDWGHTFDLFPRTQYWQLDKKGDSRQLGGEGGRTLTPKTPRIGRCRYGV